jgi:hypothetical protein
MNTKLIKSEIIRLTDQALALVPLVYVPNLPEIKGMSGVPDWHEYERKIWSIGEEIQQILVNHKQLKIDTELLDLFLKVCLNRNAKRGRQSFIMLFEHNYCAVYADQLITQMDDEFVYGHVLRALNKMQADGYALIVLNHQDDKIAWIRKQAKKYLTAFN